MKIYKIVQPNKNASDKLNGNIIISNIELHFTMLNDEIRSSNQAPTFFFTADQYHFSSKRKKCVPHFSHYLLDQNYKPTIFLKNGYIMPYKKNIIQC